SFVFNATPTTDIYTLSLHDALPIFSVLGAICGILFVNVARGKPAGVLMGAVMINALISAILFWPATHSLFPVGVTIDGLLRPEQDRKSTRLNSSHVAISYAVFCLKK